MAGIEQIFGGPIINTNSLKSIHSDQNTAWNNKAHSLIAQMSFLIISS